MNVFVRDAFEHERMSPLVEDHFARSTEPVCVVNGLVAQHEWIVSSIQEWQRVKLQLLGVSFLIEFDLINGELLPRMPEPSFEIKIIRPLQPDECRLHGAQNCHDCPDVQCSDNQLMLTCGSCRESRPVWMMDRVKHLSFDDDRYHWVCSPAGSCPFLRGEA